MAITASMVKELRNSTGAGMMDAKKALTENDGDMEASVDWLRTKGLAKAAKNRAVQRLKALWLLALLAAKVLLLKLTLKQTLLVKTLISKKWLAVSLLLQQAHQTLRS